MKSGNPFDTDARDELRARQRIDLRLVHDEVLRIAIHEIGPALSIPDEDRALIEAELRGWADHRRKESTFSALLDGLDRLERGEVLERFGRRTYLDRQGRAEKFGLVLEKCGAELTEGLSDPTREEMLEMADYALALLFADEVADDGYRDHRVPTQ